MGCTSSSKKQNEDECNKDVCERRKMLTGFHMSRDADGKETNFQFAIERKVKKTYEKSAVKEEEKPTVREEKNPNLYKLGIFLIKQYFF